MIYDFQTLVDRSTQGSSKLDYMRKAKKDVPEGIIPFSTADMEFKNAPEIVGGLKDYLDEAILGYATGTDVYYQSVVDWMRNNHGYTISKDWIVCTGGVVPAFIKLINAMTEPNDGVIIMSPVYFPFRMGLLANGRTPVENQLIEEGGKYRIDFADLEQKAKAPKNKILLLCSPHNPVGRVWTTAELKKIVQICLENDVFIISDEIHNDLIMPGYQHTVLATLSQEASMHSAVCTSPSKTFNLAGMQLSNIIIEDPCIRKKLQDALVAEGFMSCGILGYKACELAYTKGADWLTQARETIWGNYHYVKDFFKHHFPELTVSPLEGTYLMWIDFRPWGMTVEELSHFMIHDALLFMDEGYMFGTGGDGFERINIACPRKVLEDAMERLFRAREKALSNKKEGG